LGGKIVFMLRTKLLATLLAGISFVNLPTWAQTSPRSQFLELSGNDQQITGLMRQFYKQVSDLWLELRLDPSVDADGVRKQLDAVSEQIGEL
jgi:hypothetical protein